MSASDTADPAIELYGANWCPDTRSTRLFLDSMGIPYRYIDIDHSRPASKWVRAHNGGKQVTPTLDIHGQILSSPSEDELADALRAAGVVS